MAHSRDSGLTVGDLRHELATWPDEARITFGSTVEGDPLVFVRFKNRSSIRKMDLLHIELVERSLSGSSHHRVGNSLAALASQ